MRLELQDSVIGCAFQAIDSRLFLANLQLLFYVYIFKTENITCHSLKFVRSSPVKFYLYSFQLSACFALFLPCRAAFREKY